MANLLFSIDLEEFYTASGKAAKGATPVDQLTERYLEFLRECGGKATFFVVGDLARSYPDLLQTIASEGHELACHGDRHITLDRMDRVFLLEDLLRNCDAVSDACGVRPIGFRAPLLSLTSDQEWAYEVLSEAGFLYSSSVLPAKNPLYAWPEFGEEYKRIGDVYEMPVTVGRVAWMTLPFFSGAYFRALPWFMIRRAFTRASRLHPISGYLHPYDIDTNQPKTLHKELANRRYLNPLLFANRKSVLKRLRKVVEMGYEITRYRSIVPSEN